MYKYSQLRRIQNVYLLNNNYNVLYIILCCNLDSNFCSIIVNLQILLKRAVKLKRV